METKLMQMTGAEPLKIDCYLNDYQKQLCDRWNDFKHQLYLIEHDHHGIMNFSDPAQYGFFVRISTALYKITEFDLIPLTGEQPELVFRQWSGNARKLAVVGDFNNWNESANASTQQEFGVHTVVIPFVKVNGKWACPIQDGSKLKIFMETHQGERLFRHPLHCYYAEYNPATTSLEPVFKTEPKFAFKAPHPNPDQTLKIYETHIGMSSPKPEINTYKNFTKDVLPLIKEKNYNAIQIMAVAEHSYYGCFGYQVTSFFAASSRYGPPQDFKELVETAHQMGIMVFLDLVHSHASKNEADGISRYDGSDFLFLAEDHPLWDSKVFNYKHPECLRYLLQNLRFWLDEFNIDGFRFDGCMSMMYWHRSAGCGYTGRYGEYFDDDSRVDVGALTYLRLAHLLFEKYNEKGRKITSIAEDVSGYPTLASPLSIGGLGFDYRFQMAAPDLWVSMMKKGFDQGLNDQEVIEIGKIRHALVNRRYQEKHIVYAECHDQSLVGDKTLLMWLLNEQIYYNMSIFQKASDRTQRGISLHKLIRLITCSLGGEGYLNFMGNEFGHPEWLDFPRPGNNWSYQLCRRQFNLEQETTRYKDLSVFDKILMSLMGKFQWSNGREYVTREDEATKLITYTRGGALFAVSFFYQNQTAVIPVQEAGKYKVILDSDESQYGGTGSNMVGQEYWAKPCNELEEWQQKQLCGLKMAIVVELRQRHALIFEKIQ
ncbi:1 [Hexamita inflata]|uniref:1,4-alpha-glucan branching enzyme n=1 Tax=Hexamita inflata TaxID=28002 RepID=A0ABP1GJ58_9EUKA